MRAIDTESLKNSLVTVHLPGQKQDVVSLGFLNKIEVQERSVFVEYKIPEANSTLEKSLEYQTKKVVRDQYPDAEIVVGFQRGSGAAPKADAPKIGSIIAIGSGKGGVGKSAVTVNLAATLKEMKYSVGILDCDVYGPSIPTMLGVEGLKPMVLDKKIQPIDSNGIKLMSAGFFVEEGQGLVWRGPMIHKLVNQFYTDVDWEGVDVLLVDLPPGTGDAPLSISQAMPLSGAVMVSTPQRISIVDVHKAHSMFQHLKIPILGIVENMTEYVCSNCGHHENIFSKGGVKEFCQKVSAPYLGEIPIDPRVRELSDQGKPFVMEHPDSPAGQAFRQIAERLRPVLRTAGDGQVHRDQPFFERMLNAGL